MIMTINLFSPSSSISAVEIYDFIFGFAVRLGVATWIGDTGWCGMKGEELHRGLQWQAKELLSFFMAYVSQQIFSHRQSSMN